MSFSPNILDRELDKFVESPTRTGKTAVEVVGSLTVTDGTNNKDKVLKAEDLHLVYAWLDAGTKNERIDKITYTASSVPGVTVERQFLYLTVGSKYVLDNEQWSVL